MWSKVSPKRQEIIEKIFAIDKSLGIQSIVHVDILPGTESFLYYV